MNSKVFNNHNKLLLLLVLFFTFFTLCSPVRSSTITIIIDGVPLKTDVRPIMEQGRILIPLRSCAEALNASVDYNSDTKSIVMQKNDSIITLYVGSTLAYTKDQVLNLDVPARIKDGVTLVPLRFIGEALNAKVVWDIANNGVFINTNSSTTPPTQPTEPNEPTIPTDPTQPNQPAQSEQPNQGGNTTEEKPDQAQALNKQELINTLLNSCNYIRQQKNLTPLVLSTDLGIMSISHSEDMLVNNFFRTTSPSKGDVNQRAKIFNLPTPVENIAKVNLVADGSIKAAVDGWINNSDTRLNLLNPSARYVSFGLAYLESEPNIVYITADFFLTSSYLTMPLYQQTNKNQIDITGKSLSSNATITVYRLSSTNTNLYAEKNSVDVPTDKDGDFKHNIKFWVPGNYIIQTGNSIIQIKYN